MLQIRFNKNLLFGMQWQMSNKKPTTTKKPEIVQVKNPKTNLYAKIDRTAGKVISIKTTKGPYKNVPVARKPK